MSKLTPEQELKLLSIIVSGASVSTALKHAYELGKNESPWMPINSEDDWPDDKKEYLFITINDSFELGVVGNGYVTILGYDCALNVQNFKAYMPIPEYKEQDSDKR